MVFTNSIKKRKANRFFLNFFKILLVNMMDYYTVSCNAKRGEKQRGKDENYYTKQKSTV